MYLGTNFTNVQWITSYIKTPTYFNISYLGKEPLPLAQVYKQKQRNLNSRVNLTAAMFSEIALSWFNTQYVILSNNELYNAATHKMWSSESALFLVFFSIYAV